MKYLGQKCICCNEKKVINLINLSKYPITGFFKKKENFYKRDLKLYICNSCQHIFHQSCLNIKFYLKKNYLNKPAKNYLSNQALNFFSKFVSKNISNTKKNFLEIGAGDISLFKLLEKNTKTYNIIDVNIDNYKNKKLRIHQSKLEKFELKKITKKINIDAVILSHVIEHVPRPYFFLNKIIKETGYKTKFFIEVPLTNLMIKNLRFDQIIFQHISYFTLESLINLFNKLGLKILSKKINYEHWGGSILFCLSKSIDEKNYKELKLTKNIKKKFTKNYKIFTRKLQVVNKKIVQKENIIGWGAGQNIPTMAYFLKSDYGFLKYIIDDNPEKRFMFCINTKAQIQKYHDFDKKNYYLITAIDNSKIIFKKLINLGINPKKIINIKKILNPKNFY